MFAEGGDFPYWSLSSIENAINNLEMISFFLRDTTIDWRWKWCIIATHQALYGFLICALEGTAPILTVTERDINRFPKGSPAQIIGACHAWHTEGLSNFEIAAKLESIARGQGDEFANYTVQESTVAKWLTKRPQLIGIKEALARMCATKPNTGEPFNADRNDYLPWSHSRRLVLSNDEREAINRLITELRNEFEHFIPKSWAIDTTLFPPLLTQVLRVIHFIALESNCLMYDDGQIERIAKALDDVHTELQLV